MWNFMWLVVGFPMVRGGISGGSRWDFRWLDGGFRWLVPSGGISGIWMWDFRWL